MNQLWFGLGCDWFWWVYLWVKLLSLFPWPSILWRQCQKTLSTHLWDVRGAVKNENKLECLTLWVIFSWTVFFFPVFWKCQCFDKRRNYKVVFFSFQWCAWASMSKLALYSWQVNVCYTIFESGAHLTSCSTHTEMPLKQQTTPY